MWGSQKLGALGKKVGFSRQLLHPALSKQEHFPLPDGTAPVLQAGLAACPMPAPMPAPMPVVTLQHQPRQMDL